MAGILGEFVQELNAHVYEDLQAVATVYLTFWERHSRLQTAPAELAGLIGGE